MRVGLISVNEFEFLVARRVSAKLKKRVGAHFRLVPVGSHSDPIHTGALHAQVNW